MTARHVTILGALILTGSLLPGAARAAGASDRDGSFLRTESQGAAYELAIAQLATQKATASGIKSYAQMVVSDHDQLNAELRQLASAKGVNLPADMTSKQQSDLRRLQGLSGDAFDRAYKEETTRINAEDVKEDREELAATADADIRTFVQKLRAADIKHEEAGHKL